jgi:hypothetical protein
MAAIKLRKTSPSPVGRGVRGEGQMGLNPYRMVSLTPALSQRERELKSLNLMALRLRMAALPPFNKGENGNSLVRSLS